MFVVDWDHLLDLYVKYKFSFGWNGSSGMELSYPNIFIRFSIIILCHHSFKEGLEKRPENQDNVSK